MTTEKTGANAVQFGGAHYKIMAIEPWDYTLGNSIGHGEATAIEYLSRWRNKGGIVDLQKAIHWIQKVIEVETARLAAADAVAAPFHSIADTSL